MVGLCPEVEKGEKGIAWGVPEVERRVDGDKLEGGAEESDGITRVSYLRSPGIRSVRLHVACPYHFALPRRQTFVGGSHFNSKNPPKFPEKSIYAMDQSTVLYALVSFLVLLISSVSLLKSEIRIWTYS